MLNRNKYRPVMAAKYFGAKWMKSEDNKSSVPLLEMYDDYLNFITDNAVGCELPIADFQHKLKEVHPTATVKDGIVKGLTTYIRKVPPPPPVKTQLEKEIEWALSYVFHNHGPNLEYKGFTTDYILKAISYDSNAPQISEEQISDYLEKSDLYFQHPTKHYWLREWRG